MTYTEATKHNTQYNLSSIWKMPKEIADGANLRWVQDPLGRIGYIRTSRPDAFLVHYPIQAFKVTFRCSVQSYNIDEFKKFKLLKGCSDVSKKM